MDFGIQGKVALVLGAGGGLGAAIAVALAREGAVLALADCDETALNKTREAIETMGTQAITLAWNLSDLDRIDDHVGAVEDRLGPISILINNTGGPPPTPAGGQDMKLWREGFESMVLSVISLTDRLLPAMRTAGWGRIVTSTSSGVIAPIPNLGVSNALRLSLVGWSKTLAREVARDGITCNVVLPGRVATNRIRFLDEARATREGRDVDDVIAESAASIPVGRYGRPEEYADVVAFLVSSRASYVTGSVVRVDGGLIANI